MVLLPSLHNSTTPLLLGVCSLLNSKTRILHSAFYILHLRVAASPGFAPGPPVSETGALLITRRGRNQNPDDECRNQKPNAEMPVCIFRSLQPSFQFAKSSRFRSLRGAS